MPDDDPDDNHASRVWRTGECAGAGAVPRTGAAAQRAQEALKRSRAVPAAERCYIYNRLSQAWSEVARYANDNRMSCQVSNASLKDFDRYSRAAAKDRDNVCAGRPLRPYGADIIQH